MSFGPAEAFPYLSPYFAAKAAMDALAVSYASELTRWGIETSIVVPGACCIRWLPRATQVDRRDEKSPARGMSCRRICFRGAHSIGPRLARSL